MSLLIIDRIARTLLHSITFIEMLPPEHETIEFRHFAFNLIGLQDCNAPATGTAPSRKNYKQTKT